MKTPAGHFRGGINTPNGYGIPSKSTKAISIPRPVSIEELHALEVDEKHNQTFRERL